MIVVKISGGLGNQMFQGALVLSLIEKQSREVLIDTSYFFENPDSASFLLAELFCFDDFLIFRKLVNTLQFIKMTTHKVPPVQ